jgi:hypothetical protein
MLRRVAPGAPVDALRVLADTLDPLGIEHREVFQRYTQETQLNRMVDAARGDSAVVRRMERLVREWLVSGGVEREWEIRRGLMLWRDNHARLAPFGAGAPLLREFFPISEDLGKLGALDRRLSGKCLERGWGAVVRAMGEPRLEVRLAAARVVALLVGR